jgi:hypothetical protein
MTGLLHNCLPNMAFTPNNPTTNPHGVALPGLVDTRKFLTVHGASITRADDRLHAIGAGGLALYPSNQQVGDHFLRCRGN